MLYQSGPKSQREMRSGRKSDKAMQHGWQRERAGAGLGSGSWEEVEVKTEGRIRNLEETGNRRPHQLP